MVTLEEIEQYKTWFSNLSFFGGQSFVLDEIEELWNLINYIGFYYGKYRNNGNVWNRDYTKMDEELRVHLVKQFFHRHDIAIDIDEERRKGILTLHHENKKKDEVMKTSCDGSCYYDENGLKKVDIFLEGNILDSAVMVHEMMHYLNQTEGCRSFTNDLLTESVSYASELIFFEDLKNTVYCVDRNTHFYLLALLLYHHCNQIYPIYQMIYLYKKENDMSLCSYQKYFGNDGYEAMLKQFQNYVTLRRSVLKDTWLVLGLPLAIYILDAYQKNEEFFSSLKRFHLAIQENSIAECLSAIGIHSRSDLIKKIKDSTQNFTSFLDGIDMVDGEKRK